MVLSKNKRKFPSQSVGGMSPPTMGDGIQWVQNHVDIEMTKTTEFNAESHMHAGSSRFAMGSEERIAASEMMISDALHNETSTYYIVSSQGAMNGRAETLWDDSLSATHFALLLRGRLVTKTNKFLLQILIIMTFAENYHPDMDDGMDGIISHLFGDIILTYYMVLFGTRMWFTWGRRYILLFQLALTSQTILIMYFVGFRNKWFHGANEPLWTLAFGCFVALDLGTAVVSQFADRRFVLQYDGTTVRQVPMYRCLGFISRSFYVIYFNREVRHAMRSVLRVITKIGPISFVLLCFFIAHYLITVIVVPGNIPDDAAGADIWNFCPGEEPWEALWWLYVCLTTANHPDLFMPLYHSQTWSSAISISFMFFTDLICLNLLLAVVAGEFSDFMETYHLQNFQKQLAMLDTAFDNLAEKLPGTTKRAIPIARMRSILSHLSQYDVSKRHRVPEELDIQHRAELGGNHLLTDYDFRDLLITMIRKNTKGGAVMSDHIGEREFRQLLIAWVLPIKLKSFDTSAGRYEVRKTKLERGLDEAQQLNAKMLDEDGDGTLTDAEIKQAVDEGNDVTIHHVEKYKQDLECLKLKTPDNWDAKFPTIHWFVFEAEVKFLKIVISCRTFGVILMILSVGSAMMNFSDTHFLLLTLLITIQVCMKAVASMTMWDNLAYLSTYDAWIELSGVILMYLKLVSATTPDCVSGYVTTEDYYYTFYLVIRLGTVFQIMFHVRRLKVLILSIGRTMPLVMPMFHLLLALLIFYGALGMALFGCGENGTQTGWTPVKTANGTVLYDGPGDWSTEPYSSTAYGSSSYYYDLNFSNMWRAFTTLFMLMIQNNWHVTANGFEETHGKWTRAFFLSFNVIAAMIMMNVVMGILIEKLDLFRRAELSKRAAEENDIGAKNAFGQSVLEQIGKYMHDCLSATDTPSGHSWGESWEICDKPSSSEELFINWQMIHEIGSKSWTTVDQNESDPNDNSAEHNVLPNADEISVAQSNGFYSSVIAEFCPPMFARTPEGVITFANRHMCDLLFEEDVGDVIGKSEEQFFSLSDMQLFDQTKGVMHGSIVWDDFYRTKHTGKTFCLHFKTCEFDEVYKAGCLSQQASDWSMFQQTTLVWLVEQGSSSNIPTTPSMTGGFSTFGKHNLESVVNV